MRMTPLMSLKRRDDSNWGGGREGGLNGSLQNVLYLGDCVKIREVDSI